MKKAMAAMLVSLTKEINKNYFVWGQQHGGYDVKCKHLHLTRSLKKDNIIYIEKKNI